MKGWHTHLQKGLEWHAPEATKRTKHSQRLWKVLHEVMFWPLQPLVLVHRIKRLQMSSDEFRQLIRFLICEHVLHHLLNHCSESLQAQPARMLAPLVSQEGLDQGTGMDNKEKGLGCIQIQVLLVLLLPITLLVKLRDSLATWQTSIEMCDIDIQAGPCVIARQAALSMKENLKCERTFRANNACAEDVHDVGRLVANRVRTWDPVWLQHACEFVHALSRECFSER